MTPYSAVTLYAAPSRARFTQGILELQHWQLTNGAQAMRGHPDPEHRHKQRALNPTGSPSLGVLIMEEFVIDIRPEFLQNECDCIHSDV